jgi:hypothetical protein
MGNQNSGRRPAPTKLKLLRGNPGKRKPNQDEPQPPEGVTVRPADLSAGAMLVWDELAPTCLAMGTLTVADVTPFRTMCELEATLRAASAGKAVGGDEGAVAMKRERETAIAVRPFYALFGLEPVSRARIRVPKGEAPKSKWA